MSEGPLTVEQFLRLLALEAERFQEDWKRRVRNDPGAFPKTLPPAAWWNHLAERLPKTKEEP